MTSIYMNAASIEIWLGAEENDSALAMDELNLLANTVRDNIAKQRAKNGGDLLRDFLSLSSIVDQEARELNEGLGGSAKDTAIPAAETAMKPFVASAIYNLWARPWWRRVWVIQEATVPGSKRVFRCGNRSISWLKMMVATGSLRNSFNERLILIEEGAWTVDRMPSLATTRLGLLFGSGSDPMKLLLVQQRRVNKIEDPLSELLPMSRSLRATDDKDRVYGLIGMATDVDNTLFTVDYSKSVEVIYREIATYLIRTSHYGRNLDILGEAHHFESLNSTRKKGLPSWVPDWRNITRTTSLLKSFLDTPKVRFQSKPLYSASGLDKTFIAKHWRSGDLIDFKENELHICGLYLDTIEELIELPILKPGQKKHKEQPPIGCKKAWRRLRKVIPFHLGPIYRSQRYGIESIYDAFRRTVCADLQYNGHNSLQGLCDPTRGMSMSDSGDLQPWTGNDYTCCYGRKLAITRGDCMGLVSAAARFGDKIFVLAGGQVLHTLRRQWDGYRYVGDCYLHGFMDGEGLLRLKDGTVELERVRIC